MTELGAGGSQRKRERWVKGNEGVMKAPKNEH